MTDKEVLEQIKQSAKQIEIPDSITPERLSEKLRSPKKPSPFRHISLRNAVSAAAVLLFCGILSGVAWNMERLKPDNPALSKASPKTEAISENKNTGASPASGDAYAEPKQDAGTLYTVAKSYDEIYQALESAQSQQAMMRKDSGLGIMQYAEKEVETAAADSSTNGSVDLASPKNNYSTTNLQTEGVDESDYIKTDGRYIYTVAERKILITDTADGAPKAAGSIAPELGPADSILELYVDNGSLLLLVQRQDASFDMDTTYMIDEGETPKQLFQSQSAVILYIYDISDPLSPKLSGAVEQDGFYKTSRKIGDLVYLFTENPYPRNTETGRDKWIPSINGGQIPYGNIYLPKEGGSSELILASFHIQKPEEVIDQMMILHNDVNVYVGPDSLYLYEYDYSSEETITHIAKFALNDGKMNAVNAASARGEIYDTFAIHEYQNTLRVLTTSLKAGETSNNLFLFDEKMELTGTLDSIAVGEQIYAARFMGTTAYFITYRNTDPLFAVDLSDVSNPVLLGELKITGFSDYLHMWDEGHLLGIGYETDPETGEQKGIKLVMFDISNPAELKVIDSVILDEYYYTPASYDYKSVLVNSGKNLIGFSGHFDPKENGFYIGYQLYSWEDGHFAKKLSEPLDVSSETIRGIYIGNYFYIATPQEIISFDIENAYKKESSLTLQE